MKNSNWTQEEIDFLKRYYATCSNQELAESLQRTPVAVKSKAISLDLTKENPNIVIVDGKKRCSKCGEMLELAFFYKTTKNKIGYSSSCRICKSEKGMRKLNNEALKQKTGAEKYVCKVCGEEKPGWEFKWSSTKKKREHRCAKCREIKNKESKVKRIKEGKDW